MNTTYLTVLDLLAKSTGIMLLAFAVQSLWRRTSAAHRSLVWLVAFLCVAALPLTLLLKPHWSLVLPADKPTPAPVLRMTPRSELEVSALNEAPEVEPMQPRRMPQITVPQALAALWLLGAGLLLAKRALGAWQLRRLRVQSRECDDERTRCLAMRLASEFSLRRPLDLRCASDAVVPMTWGTLKPVLLLPAESSDWSDARLEAALSHELGHIMHFDAMARLLTTFVTAVFWPNPVVWLAAKSWRIAQEQAADDLVISTGAEADDYAMQILEAARVVQETGLLHAPVMAMAQPSTLEKRLSAIMDGARDRQPTSRGALWLGGLGGSMLLALCASLRVQAATESNHEPQIAIDVKLIEANAGFSAKEMTNLAKDRSGQTIIAESRVSELMAKWGAVKGVDVLSAPRVITLSGHEATIEVGQQIPVSGDVKRTEFNGVKVTLLPTLLGGGLIEVKGNALVRDLEGSQGGRPIVRERKVNTTVKLASGNTVVLTSASGKKGGDDRELIFLITANKTTPGDQAAAPSEAAANKAISPLEEKAKHIIIPKALFQHATLQETIEYLRLQSKEHDPEKQGLNIIIRNPSAPSTAEISLDLKEIPLSELLKYVTELSGMVAIYEPFAIVVTHPPHRGAEILTRSFRVTKDWIDTVKDPQAWLANQGMRFPEGTSAKFSPKQAELIVKAAEPELEKAEALIEKAGMQQETKEAAPSAAAKAAQAIILPKVVFQNATIEEVVDYLRTKGANIIIKKSAEDESPNVTLSLANVPLLEALRYSAELAQLQLTADDNAIVLQSWSFTPASKGSKASVGEVPKALVHARTIVFPSIEFRDATVTEVADFLRIKSRQLDPSKAGVNLVLKPDAAVASAKITLSLKNVSLNDALKYVAALAGLELKADDSALVLQKGK